MKILKVIVALILTILINYGIYLLGKLIDNGSIISNYVMGLGFTITFIGLLFLIVLMFLGILNLFD